MLLQRSKRRTKGLKEKRRRRKTQTHSTPGEKLLLLFFDDCEGEATRERRASEKKSTLTFSLSPFLLSARAVPLPKQPSAAMARTKRVREHHPQAHTHAHTHSIETSSVAFCSEKGRESLRRAPAFVFSFLCCSFTSLLLYTLLKSMTLTAQEAHTRSGDTRGRQEGWPQDFRVLARETRGKRVFFGK